jgi:hypothetical protein
MTVASFLQPVLPIALAVTLVVQGFACSYIAAEQIKGDRNAAGTAGMTGAVVYLAGLNWALAAGILAYLLLEGGAGKIAERARVLKKRRARQ